VGGIGRRVQAGGRTGRLQRRLAWAAALGLLAPPLWAADLTVRVSVRDTGEALAGASVCVGTPADPAQFGARRTGEEGSAVFSELPRAPIVITVSKEGYRGRRLPLEGLGADHQLLLAMPWGGGGPECTAPPRVAEAEESERLGVARFRIEDGAAVTRDRAVTLSYTLTGQATHYRASERRDFRDSQWRALDESPEYELSEGSGTKTVYFQVRRHESVGQSEIETLSNVASDSIVLSP